ncbi:hypothetical protein GCM10027199_66050 [Amycolatopsis magusensis]
MGGRWPAGSAAAGAPDSAPTPIAAAAAPLKNSLRWISAMPRYLRQVRLVDHVDCEMVQRKLGTSCFTRPAWFLRSASRTRRKVRTCTDE